MPQLLESRSIDYVPLAERHGKVWHLWPVWFSGDAHLATLAVGVLGITLGGNLLWTAVAVIAGACSAPSSWRSIRPRGRSSACRR